MIPDRGELARRLLGAGRRFSPDRDAVAELLAERASEVEIPAWKTPPQFQLSLGNLSLSDEILADRR